MSVEPKSPNMQHMAVVRTKPLMTMPAILIMNLGFFGIQYSFGLQQTAINPVYEFLGANPGDLPILNLAGPITGLLLQPLIGALSDRTWSPRYGTPEAVLSDRRDRLQPLPVPVPVRHRGVDGSHPAVAARRQQQHGHGALPRLHRRQAAAIPTG